MPDSPPTALPRVSHTLTNQVHAPGEDPRRTLVGRTLRRGSVMSMPDSYDPSQDINLATTDYRSQQHTSSISPEL